MTIEDKKQKLEKEYLFESLCEDLKNLQTENGKLRKALEQEPSTEPVSKMGHWVLDESDNSLTCDRCGCLIWASDIHHGEAYYCPNCGCRMGSEGENENHD